MVKQFIFLFNPAFVTLAEKGEKDLDLSENRVFLHSIISFLTEEKRRQLESSLEILRDSAFNMLSITQKTIMRPSLISKYYWEQAKEVRAKRT